MAKVKGPLLSMRASGSIAKTNVYSQWRGIPYARIHVVPSNPRTVAQVLTRDVFRWINLLYRTLGPIGQGPWLDATIGRPLTSRNSMIKNNLFNLRTDLTLVNLMASPGSHGGPALSDFTAVTGAATGEIDVTWTHGDLPAGWTLDAFGVIAIKSQIPNLAFDNSYAEGEDDTSPVGGFTLTGLEATVDYRVCGFAKYVRPDGSAAFSPSSSVEAESGT